MSKTISTTFILAMLLVLIAGNVSAALPPQSANFEIDFSQLNLPEGNWQLSVISIPAYGTDANQAKDNFNTIKSTYLDVKNLCGVPDYMELKLNPSQEEIESYADKEVIIQHYFEGSLYYILDSEEYSTCQIPIGYGSYNPNFSTISQNKYKATTNFWIHHYSKGVELKRGGKDIRAFYPPYCEIEDDLCTLHITEGTQGPYFVVLEKMNSKDEIYFSDPVNINWEASEKVKWKEFEPNTYQLNINQLEFLDSNTLVVNFEGSKSVGPTPEPEPFPSIYYWIIGLVIPVVLVIFFLVFKKKK